MINFIISMTICAVVALAFGVIVYLAGKFGPSIVNYVKQFIRWNRRK